MLWNKRVLKGLVAGGYSSYDDYLLGTDVGYLPVLELPIV